MCNHLFKFGRNLFFLQMSLILNFRKRNVTLFPLSPIANTCSNDRDRHIHRTHTKKMQQIQYEMILIIKYRLYRINNKS